MKKKINLYLVLFIIIILFINCDFSQNPIKSELNKPAVEKSDQLSIEKNLSRDPSELKTIHSLPYSTTDRIDWDEIGDWSKKDCYFEDKTYILNLNKPEKININIAIKDVNIDSYIAVEIFDSRKKSIMSFGCIRVYNSDGLRNISNISLGSGTFYIVVGSDDFYTPPFDYKIIVNLEKVSMQSYNFPSRFIRSKNIKKPIDPVYITYINSKLDKNESTFVMVPGLAEDVGGVSFKSLYYPGYYLRHRRFKLEIGRYDGSDLFREDATFKIKPGLADNQYISLESFNYPKYYIRHYFYRLYLHKKSSSSLYKKDATFKLIPPFIE